MRIALATDDFKTITGHVGRCNGFIIYDSDDSGIKKIEDRKNTFTLHAHRGGDHEHHQGHGHSGHSHQGLVEGLKDCQYLISQGAGRRLVDELKQVGIEMIITVESDPETAIEKLKKNELTDHPDSACKH
jgi:predicted Fe-Mo cluster-binding NifX family protein